ncbi:hypothetical protein CBS101457_002430 [Exobasidium rhododendri]|nr:hypothetical protein CBS101457_002430 [Exobasidium rhododendri]
MSVESSFAPHLLSDEKRKEHRDAYALSRPYRHAVVDGLINDDLLQKARQEILEELRFTEKETDIYKVNQTGDLANLDGLPEAEAKRLENVLAVRNAIYSLDFRQWLQDVTGCGPLSSKKKDMSINDYTSGCHLLNHDDVISTRRLSYILYLPDPSEPWDAAWGGALELYPVEGKHVPSNTPTVTIPPKWNQYTFFAVQPGHSFHSVEEVVHPTKSRLSISGWFHRPQSDEEGYDAADEKREEDERKDHASAEGLLSKEFDLPFRKYTEDSSSPLPGSTITASDKSFLSFFLNPAYLQNRTQSVLYDKFGDESHILLVDFLNKEFAAAIESELKVIDGQAELRWWENGGRAKAKVPSHLLGVDPSQGWSISGPPHRQRFLTLEDKAGSSSLPSTNAALPSTLPSTGTELLRLLQTHLLPSPAFRHFLSNISQLVPIGARPFQVRRFRPGLDYTLARSDDEAVLDLTLGLTPDVGSLALKQAGAIGTAPKGLAGKKKPTKKVNGAGAEKISKSTAKKLKEAWETGEVGGWEAYMPPSEEGDDPAVYGSGKNKVEDGAHEEERGEKGDKGQANDDAAASGSGKEAEEEDDDDVDMDEEEDDEEEEEEDGVLLNLTPTFNTLSLVLRDEKVMRFVKYLSASSGGSRWDVCAEFEAGAVVVEEEEGS